jgi:hypothetical protein
VCLLDRLIQGQKRDEFGCQVQTDEEGYLLSLLITLSSPYTI